jgi:hypothetical protein
LRDLELVLFVRLVRLVRFVGFIRVTFCHGGLSFR